MEQLAELSQGLGIFIEQTTAAIEEDPAGFAMDVLEKAKITAKEGVITGIENVLTGGLVFQVKAVQTVMGICKEISEYYSDTSIGKCQKIEKTGEAFGGLCLLVIDIGTAVKDISVADVKLMVEALETGSKTALAMASGDVRAMGQSLKHLLTEEAVEAFEGMTKKEARYLTRSVESLSKETGDFVSDHLFATLRHQFEKGTSRAKAVKLAKKLFHKRQAVGRMYNYLDDAARAALYEFVEAEDVLEEEVEQLGKIAQAYQAQTEKALTKTQLDDLLGDSRLGTKNVEEVVAGLQIANEKLLKSNFINRIKEIRAKMPNRKLRKEGNMAIADVDIPNIKESFIAHSNINDKYKKGADVADFSFLKPEGERTFTTYVDVEYSRYHDTEAKILEDIASQITNKNISGKINMYSELPCCQSCSNIISEFREMFPNIELNVFVE